MSTPDSSRLSALIEIAADSGNPLADVLRQVKILAARIAAPELGAWADSELNGYRDKTTLPHYRQKRLLPIVGVWMGPVNSISMPVSMAGVTNEFFEDHFKTAFPHPLRELESITTADEDPSIQWDPFIVHQYNRLVTSAGVSYASHQLIEARAVVSRSMLAGILDSIRSKVLDLALELEQVAPESGEIGGPTIKDKDVAAATQNFYINVTGNGTNVTTGDFAEQSSTH